MGRYFKTDSYILKSDKNLQEFKILPFKNVAREGVNFVPHKIQTGDRLDNLAYDYFGDPKKYYLIMDYNDLLCPFDLLDYVGDYLRIPIL